MADDWMHAYHQCDWWTGDKYPTREAAIAAGRIEHAGKPFDIGRSELHDPMPPDADDIIDTLACRADDNCGSEVAEDWLSHVSKEARQELTDAVYDAVLAWLKKHKEMPTFYRITDVETIQPEASNG